MSYLHKYLRHLRVEKGDLLKDMADKLGLGSAELSQIEQEKKPMPKGFMQKIQSIYIDKD